MSGLSFLRHCCCIMRTFLLCSREGDNHEAQLMCVRPETSILLQAKLPACPYLIYVSCCCSSHECVLATLQRVGYAKQINNLLLSFKDNRPIFVQPAHLIPVWYGCPFPEGGAIEADRSVFQRLLAFLTFPTDQVVGVVGFMRPVYKAHVTRCPSKTTFLPDLYIFLSMVI